MGTSIWWAMMPSETSAAMWASITELARRYQKDDPAVTASEARTQAFADLVLRGVEVRAEVTLGMPVVGESSPVPEWARHPHAGGQPGDLTPDGATAHTSMTFTSHDASLDFASEGSPVRDFATACTPTTIAGVDCWVSGVEVPKVGYIPPEAVAALLSDADLNVGRALLEADAGVLREACSAAYRPTAAMRKFVQARDVTCRMFGCSRAVIRCDLDHGKAWPAGDTRCTNLCGLCRRHHRTKQQRRWSFSMTSNGECTWTAPTGAKRSTYPPAMAPEHPPSPPSVPPSPRRTSYDDSDPPPF
jgi:hypothetical protein